MFLTEIHEQVRETARQFSQRPGVFFEADQQVFARDHPVARVGQ